MRKSATKKKWSLELISISKSEAGGLKEVIASIKGINIYSTLKYESGVHRVQRVPDTETQGRVHTSQLQWLFARGRRSRFENQ